MAGTWSTPYASARSRSMARLSTSTVIWLESSATSRTSCSFCWQSSAAASSCEKTTSFTGPAMRSNSLRTAAWSRSVRIGMAPLYLLESRCPSREGLAETIRERLHCDQRRSGGCERSTERLGEPRLAVDGGHRYPDALAPPHQSGRVRRAVVEDDHDDGRAEPRRGLELARGRRQPGRAREADDAAIGMDEVGRDRGG